MTDCSPVELGDILEAVDRGEMDRAGGLLLDYDGAIPLSARAKVARVYLAKRQWQQANELLERIIHKDDECQLNLMLVRNMLAMQTHRPVVYEQLMTQLKSDEKENNATAGTTEAGEPKGTIRTTETKGDNTTIRQYQIVAGKNNQAVVMTTNEAGKRVCMSADFDPAGALEQALSQLLPRVDEGQAFGLLGIGDGYLLSHVAKHRLKLTLGREQSIYVIEPDGQAVVAAMMIHDYTDENGAIEQERIQWFVGEGWSDRFMKAMIEDELTWPSATITQSVCGEQLNEHFMDVGLAYESHSLEIEARVKEYYSNWGRESLLGVLSDKPTRPPRMLLLTTRFSTVLQHATRDVAAAMEELGWETYLLIEPTDCHRPTRLGMLKVLDAFRPDVVFQLDHHRQEHHDIFPENLPFICWIQDHLSNLTNKEVGRKLGVRDYVLTATRSWYVNQYDYPARQCIDLSKLTKIKKLPSSWSTDGDELVYVSNASKTPDQIIEEIVESLPDNQQLVDLVMRCCKEVLRIYESGDYVRSHYEMREILSACEKSLGTTIKVPDVRDQLVRRLYDQLNNALYRQQALGWVKRIAERKGLTLALYGQGWEDNEAFAECGRGVIDYGEALEKVTRVARINFQIVPYSCMHQRLLDGLASGGFFLIREHAYDLATDELAGFIKGHLSDDIDTVDQARAMLNDEQRGVMEDILERSQFLYEHGDPVGLIQSWWKAKLFTDDGRALPRYDEVAFCDEKSLERLIDRYIENDSLRQEVATVQRRSIEMRLSYKSGMKRVMEQIYQLVKLEE